ncbi:MAG TPA: gamma-glutamylcyclotransferase [Candidatus Eisenbacteria bacterium]|nr:gamma-glutamylcyclotransferase [Candidatus Eisenbacteria bacterium]
MTATTRLFLYGTLLEEIDAPALAAFDAYEDEGRLYVRRDAVVTVDGAPVRCQVYQARRPPG